MTNEQSYCECVKQLEKCVAHLKDITHKLENIRVKDIVLNIESEVEILQHTLEQEMK